MLSAVDPTELADGCSNTCTSCALPTSRSTLQSIEGIESAAPAEHSHLQAARGRSLGSCPLGAHIPHAGGGHIARYARRLWLQFRRRRGGRGARQARGYGAAHTCPRKCGFDRKGGWARPGQFWHERRSPEIARDCKCCGQSRKVILHCAAMQNCCHTDMRTRAAHTRRLLLSHLGMIRNPAGRLGGRGGTASRRRARPAAGPRAAGAASHRHTAVLSVLARLARCAVVLLVSADLACFNWAVIKHEDHQSPRCLARRFSMPRFRLHPCSTCISGISRI